MTRRNGWLPVLVSGLLALSTSPSLAQRIAAEGSVATQDGSPVAGAQILTLDPSGKTVGKSKTKASGKFRMFFFPTSESGPYRFQAVKKDLLMSSVTVKLLFSDGRVGGEFENEIGPLQDMPSFEILPTRSVVVDLVMVPKSHFASYLTIPGDRKATETLTAANRLSSDGNYAESSALLQGLVDEGKANASVYYLLGRNAAAMKRHEDVVRWFGKSLELSPAQKGAHGQLGLAYFELGDKEKALEHYDAELEISPDLLEVAINRGLILRDLGRLEAAAAALERSIELDPRESMVYAELVSLSLDMDQPDKAAEYMTRLEQAGDADPTLWFNVGANLSNRKRFDEAIAAYGRALELNPEFAEAHREIGFLQIRTGNQTSAVQHLDKYLALRPDAADAAQVRGVRDSLVKTPQP